MKLGTLRAIACIPVAASLGAIACSGAQSTDSTDPAAEVTSPSTVPHRRILPVQRMTNAPSPATANATANATGGSFAQTATTANLKYWDGPVISHVKVFIVLWGTGVQYATNLPTFYGDVTNSQYMDWLVEYATPTQTIGRGTYVGSYTDTGAPHGSVTNDQIATELGRLIDAGSVPANDGETLYMVHFPPGVSISLDGSSSCVEFCAYHNTATHGGKNLIYGVMPDLGGGCASGCGGGTMLQNLTSVSSHELIEAITDPAIGLVTSDIGPPAGWYDETNGEIGDICNAEQGTMGTWTVQKQWSNKKKACVTVGPMLPSTDGGTPPPPPPTDAGPPPPPPPPPTNTCSHALCSTGTKLVTTCDPCATQVCASDSYCCNNKWDSQCVSEVASICGQTCP